MEKISEKLMNNIIKVNELENTNLKIKSSIFIRKINSKLQDSIKELELRIDEEIEFYGQKVKEYEEYKKTTLQKYNDELVKVCEEYELQFVNICEELQEVYANQKIAIANCKKIKNLKEEFLISEDYEQYKRNKAKYKQDMDDSLTKVEFDRNMNLLKNLKNPIDDYDNKIKASLIKAKDFEIVIEICMQKMNECIQSCILELNNVVSQKTGQLKVYNKVNIFSKIINKVTNIFKGKEKLKKYVIDQTDNEIKRLKEDINIKTEDTRKNTISFIEKLIEIKEELNNNFKENINA